MRNQIHTAFDSVRASEEQKQALKNYLAQKRSNPSQKHAPFFMRAAVVLSALLLCLAIAGLYLVRTTAYTVHIDTSPAVVLDLNRFDKVISVTASDSEEVSALEELSVEGMTCPEAVDILLDTESIQASLMENPEPSVTVEGQTGEKADQICSGIQRQVRARFRKSEASKTKTPHVQKKSEDTTDQTQSQPGHVQRRKQLRKHTNN